MKRLTDQFNGTWVTFLVDTENAKFCMFKADDIAKAVGYYDTGSLMKNIGPAKYTNPHRERFLSLGQINKAAHKARRTPIMKEFAGWARRISEQQLNMEKAAKQIAKAPAPEASEWPFGVKTLDKIAADNQLYSVKEAAEKVGMKHSEFITWMVKEEYLTTFKSNGHLKMNQWFKDHGFGKNPIADSGRVSNTVRITGKGLEYIQKHLARQRATTVFSFAENTGAMAEERMEKDVSNLIEEKFKPFRYVSDYSGLSHEEEYRLQYGDLQKIVRQVIAEIKLKEKNE